MFCESSKLEIHASQGHLTVAVGAVGCLVARVDETRCAWVADGWTAKRATSNRHVGLVTNLALADRRVVDALALRAAVMIVVGPVPRLALRSQNWFSKRKQQIGSLETCKWKRKERRCSLTETHDVRSALTTFGWSQSKQNAPIGLNVSPAQSSHAVLSPLGCVPGVQS